MLKNNEEYTDLITKIGREKDYIKDVRRQLPLHINYLSQKELRKVKKVIRQSRHQVEKMQKKVREIENSSSNL